MLEAHEKLQKLNQSLEEKLLKLAEDYHAETTRLSHQAQDLTQRLVEARIYIHQLEDENVSHFDIIHVIITYYTPCVT
jgi:predicted translin family RNA/ssDNA-binding protein